MKYIFQIRILKFFTTLFILSSIFYGISNLNTHISLSSEYIQNFSAIGIVDSINTTSLVLVTNDNISSSTLTLDTTEVQKIETQSYIPISFSNLSKGDRVIVQGGMYKDGLISIRRIISLSPITIPITLTETASSTENISSTTEIVNENNISSTTSLTASAIDSIPPTISSSTESISTTTNVLISTSTESIATSTNIIATTTSNYIASSTQSTIESTSTIQTIIPEPIASSTPTVIETPVITIPETVIPTESPVIDNTNTSPIQND